jgi:hypothetical protein
VFNRCFHGSLLISRKKGCHFAPYAPAKPSHRPILVSFRDSQSSRKLRRLECSHYMNWRRRVTSHASWFNRLSRRSASGSCANQHLCEATPTFYPFCVCTCNNDRVLVRRGGVTDDPLKRSATFRQSHAERRRPVMHCYYWLRVFPTV